MKKLMAIAMVMAAAVVFAAQNDPLIPAEVEAGQIYQLVCKGKLIRSFKATETKNVMFQGDESVSTDINDYKVIKLGDEGTILYGEQNLVLDFDPTGYLAEGFNVVYDVAGDGKWTVAKTPIAYTQILDEDFTFGGMGGLDFMFLNEPDGLQYPITTEVMYQFDAFPTELSDYKAFLAQDENATALAELIRGYRREINANKREYIMGSDFAQFFAQLTSDQANAALEWIDTVAPYFEWNCDFVVSFDQPVKAGSYILAGNYDKAARYTPDGNSWVLACSTRDLAANEEFRLLEQGYTKPIYVNYAEICTRVQTFLCGVKNISPENYGKTMTVKLNIYDNYGNHNENDRVATVGVYKFRIEGPYTVSFVAGEDAPAGAEMPASFRYYTGRAWDLQKPTYNDDAIAFNGWLPAGAMGTGITELPANASGDMVLTALWKNITTLQVKETADAEESTLAIKLTEERLAEDDLKGKSDEEIIAELNTTEANGNMKWENYVLGLDGTDINASVSSDTKQGTVVSVPVVAKVNPPQADTGFTLSYRVDEIKEDGSTVVEGEKKADKNDLGINLDSVEKSALFQVKFTVTNDADGKEAAEFASDNTIGVLKAEAPSKETIVAIPWNKIGGGDISADQLVQTANLSTGDQLQVYDKNTQEYKVFNLGESGKWLPSDESQAEDTTIPRGSAVWVVRQDTTTPVVLCGEFDSANAEPAILEEKVAEGEPSWNIVASPSVEDLDLNEKFDEPVEGDQIIVPTAGAPKNFTFKDNAWGYDETETFVNSAGKTRTRVVRKTDDTKITAGTGFWYLNNGGERQIDWDEKKEEE